MWLWQDVVNSIQSACFWYSKGPWAHLSVTLQFSKPPPFCFTDERGRLPPTCHMAMCHSLECHVSQHFGEVLVPTLVLGGLPPGSGSPGRVLSRGHGPWPPEGVAVGVRNIPLGFDGNAGGGRKARRRGCGAWHRSWHALRHFRLRCDPFFPARSYIYIHISMNKIPHNISYILSHIYRWIRKEKVFFIASRNSVQQRFLSMIGQGPSVSKFN